MKSVLGAEARQGPKRVDRPCRSLTTHVAGDVGGCTGQRVLRRYFSPSLCECVRISKLGPLGSTGSAREGNSVARIEIKPNERDAVAVAGIWLFLDFGRSRAIQAASETVKSRVRLADQSTHQLYDAPDSVKNVFIGT